MFLSDTPVNPSSIGHSEASSRRRQTGTTTSRSRPSRSGHGAGPSSTLGSPVAQTSSLDRARFSDTVTPRALGSAFDTPAQHLPSTYRSTPSPGEVRLGDAFHDPENPGGVLVVTLIEVSEDGTVVNLVNIAYAAQGDPKAKIIIILLEELLDGNLDGGAYDLISVVRLQQIASQDLRGRSLYELVMNAVKNIDASSYPRSGDRSEETQALKGQITTLRTMEFIVLIDLRRASS